MVADEVHTNQGTAPDDTEHDVVVIISTDRRLIDGLLDPDDRRMFNESGNGKPVRICTTEVGLALMRGETDPEPDHVLIPTVALPDRGPLYQLGHVQGSLAVLNGSRSTVTAQNQATEPIQYPNFYDLLDTQKCADVRYWRVGLRMTWRAIARKASKSWNLNWGSNQIAGMKLCQFVARHFGEDFMIGDWN